MRNKMILVAMIGVTSLILSGTTFANMPKSSGTYLEGNLGYGNVNEDVSNSTKDETTGAAISGNFGYKFNTNFALEAGLASYPDQDYGTAEGDENYAAIIAAKGMIPFNNGFEIFGKVGGAMVHHHFKGKNGNTYTKEGTHSAGTGFIGIGAAFAFTPNWQGVVQVNTTTKNGDVPAMQMVTVGAAYMF